MYDCPSSPDARKRGSAFGSGPAFSCARARGSAVATLNVNQHPKKRAFLAAYAKCGIIAMACRYAEIDRGTYYLWMEHDEEFAARAGLAVAESKDHIEEEALRRATVGHTTVKEVYEIGADGQPALVRREVSEGVSDTMLAMMLNGAKPEKYKARVEHSGAIGSEPKVVAREFWESV